MSTSRRCFFQASAAFLGAGSLSAADSAPAEDPLQHYFNAFYYKEPPAFRFEYPFDGGVLQEGYGYPVVGTETGTDGVKRLKVHVVVKAYGVSNLEVVMPDGQVVPTSLVSGSYMGTVLLKDRITPIKARASAAANRSKSFAGSSGQKTSINAIGATLTTIVSSSATSFRRITRVFSTVFIWRSCGN